MFDEFDDSDLFEAEAQTPALSEGLSVPRETVECLGHGAIEMQLLSLFNKGTLPHALIFSGLNGIGKSTFAFRVARFLLSQPAETADNGLFGDDLPKEIPETMDIDPEDQVFRQVAASSHPDLLFIERRFDEKKGAYKGIVEVDEVRKITPFLRRTASQGSWRVVIVDDADTMNRNSQNAILKILEEPPKNTLLILVTHRLGTLIPTIRSRCRTVSFDVPERTVFNELMQRANHSLSTSDLDLLYGITGASVGRAVSMTEEGGLEAIDKVIGLLHSWPKWDWLQIHMFADTLSRPGQDNNLKAFRDVLLWVMEQSLQAKARNTELEGMLNNEALSLMLSHYSLEDWIIICENMKEHFEIVDRGNLDKKHMVLNAFSIFELKKAA